MSAERRRQIAEIIDGYDAEIKGLNDGKADTWGSYREELLASGLDASSVKAEIAALKAAIVKRRKLVTHPAEIEETDRLIEEIVAELLSADPSRVRTHEATEYVRPPRPPRSAYQPPRMASPRELIQARRAGNPISQDFTFQDASIYFAVSQENNCLKIGISNNVPQRIAFLAKECRDVELLGTIPGNRQEELRLLERFAFWQVEGEWFTWCPETEAMVTRILEPVTETTFDPATGEITEKGEVRAEQSALTPAETSSSEALCEHGAGAPLHPMDPAPQSISLPEPEPAHGLVEEAYPDHAAAVGIGLAPLPYIIARPAPSPEPVDPDVSPLIADAGLRQAKARELLDRIEPIVVDGVRIGGDGLCVH